MSLKEWTRKPISSREGRARCVSKSPLPTARVPAIRSCTGRARRCAETIAPWIAASMASSKTRVSVRMKLYFSGSRSVLRLPYCEYARWTTSESADNWGGTG